MTREEAYEYAVRAIKNTWNEKTCEKIMKALEKEPSGDAISRQAVIDLISKFILEIHTEGGRDLNAHTNGVLRQILRNVGSDRVFPPVNPQESKTGHWIEEDMFDGDVAYRCSECNELFWIESGTPKDNGYNFCPKCGKRLVEPRESEE